jgi:tetratricopeptide (TPR) repeat protein
MTPEISPTEALQEAVELHKAGKLAEARRLYLAILKAQPVHPGAHHNLGVIAMQTGQTKAALPHFKVALETTPSRGQYWISYVNTLINLGETDAARRILAQGRSMGLKGPVADNLSAILDSKIKTSEPSKISQLTPAPAHRPLVQPSRQRFGKKTKKKKIHGPTTDQVNAFLAQFQSGRYDLAEKTARVLVKTFPKHPFGWKALGGLLVQLEHHQEALEPLHRALAIDPNDVDSLNNLGIALHRLGKDKESEQSYRRVLEIRPDLAQTHNNLGTTLLDVGRKEEALSCYLRAVALKPDYADAYRNLGNAYYALERFEEAKESYECALRIAPRNKIVLNTLGSIHRERGQAELAVMLFLKAIEVDDCYAEAHTNLGMAFKTLEQFELAIQHLKRAVEIDPKCAQAFTTLGAMSVDRGDFVQAELNFRKALESDPEQPEAWAMLARMRRMNQEDRDWLVKAEELATRPLPARQVATLHFAMGKYHDDVGDYAAAFSHYAKANAVKKTVTPDYDRKNQEGVIDALISAYPQDVVATLHPGSSPSLRPLFIVGMPRSGTSLTEQIMASHPEVFGAGELRFWNELIVKHKDAVLTGVFFPEFLTQMARDCEANLDRFDRQASRVVDKMPGNFLNIGFIHAVFPNVRFIHMQRNPVDTCLSIYFQNFNKDHAYANDLEDLAHYYGQYHRLMEHFRSVFPEDILLEVPYEALIEDQEVWTRKIIDFIGLDWDDACLSFHKTKRKVGTASNRQVRQKIYKTSKERWRRYEDFVGPLLPLLKLYQPNIQP